MPLADTRVNASGDNTTMRILGLGILALVLNAGAQTADITASWYPLQPGNSWIYQKESLAGDMAYPDFERWTTQETIVSAAADPELGEIMVTKATKVLSDILSSGFVPANDLAKREQPESHLLIRQSCVYLLDGLDANGAADALDRNHHVVPAYRKELLRGHVPADFCFPMAKGMTWGRVPNTSPANEYVWDVTGLNADPFGTPVANTFRLSSHLGSGEQIDRWFEEGVGVIQEVNEHHGTYDELRRQLLKATIRGKTQSYRLISARTVPLSKDDCAGSGWRHFSRSDGAAFSSFAACVRSIKNTP